MVDGDWHWRVLRRGSGGVHRGVLRVGGTGGCGAAGRGAAAAGVVQHGGAAMSGSFAHVLNWHSRPACVDVMDANTWTLARDVVAGAGEVSTVWNPVAFNTWRVGTPKHFETMVFLPEGGCGDSCTYVTEEEARDGHTRMVSALRSLAEAQR